MTQIKRLESRITGIETRIRRMTPMTRILNEGQKAKIWVEHPSVTSLNPCKASASRIKWIARMTRIKRLETRIIRMPQMTRIFNKEQKAKIWAENTSVKSFNPCKSVVQTMGVAVWN